MPTRRVICVLNRKSRDGQIVHHWETLSALFREQDVEATVLDLAEGDLAGRLARELSREPLPMTVAGVGGDGTHMAVLNALAELQAREPTRWLPPYAVCPFGTGNDVAKSLGLQIGTRHLGQIVETLLNGEVRTWDLGRWGDMVFADALCIGMDAEVLRLREALMARLRQHPRLNALLRGYPLYAMATTRATLAMPRWHGRIEIDGKPWFEGAFNSLTINNCRIHAAMFDVTPDARVDDGRLDVLLIPHLPMYLVRYGLGFRQLPDGLKRLAPIPWIRPLRVQASQIVVTLREPTPVQLDGESFDPQREVRVEAVPGAVGFRSPRGSQVGRAADSTAAPIGALAMPHPAGDAG